MGGIITLLSGNKMKFQAEKILLHATKGSITINSAKNTDIQSATGISYDRYEDKEVKSFRPNDYIIDMFWCDKNRYPIKFLKYNNDRDDVYINCKFSSEANGKSAIIGIYAFDPPNDFPIAEINIIINSEEKFLSHELKADDFAKVKDCKAEFYLKIDIEGDNRFKNFFLESNIFCREKSKRLQVHIVRYVPSIMKDKGWLKGYELQKKWFSFSANKRPVQHADIANIITLDWALGYKRVKEVYDKLILDKIWINEKGKHSLIAELKKMKRAGEFQMPTKSVEVTKFGNFSLKETLNFKSEKCPEIDKYYFQERAFKQANDERDLDDLFAALANFSFRLAAKGEIYLVGNTYSISIKEIGIYIRDSFDFNDDTLISQPLGWWDLNTKAISSKLLGAGNLIQNKDYDQYRTDTNEGQDFLIYSDVKTILVNNIFTVGVQEFLF